MTIGARALRLMRLPTWDRWLLLCAVVLVAAIRVALWILPLRTVTAILDQMSKVPVGAGSSAVERIAWATSVSRELVPGATCLAQALAVRFLLRRHGLSARLCIGMKRIEGDGIRAHAWVESDGQVIGGHLNHAIFT